MYSVLLAQLPVSVRAWLLGAFTPQFSASYTNGEFPSIQPRAGVTKKKQQIVRTLPAVNTLMRGQVKCFFWQRQDLGEDPLFGFYTPDSCRAALANLRVADNGPPKGHWSGPTPTHTTPQGHKSQDATPTTRPVAAAALGRTAMDAGARACSTVPGSVCFFSIGQ